MVKNGEVDITSRYESLNRNNVIGDFKFVLIEKFLSYDNDFPWYERIILDLYYLLKKNQFVGRSGFRVRQQFGKSGTISDCNSPAGRNQPAPHQRTQIKSLT